MEVNPKYYILSLSGRVIEDSEEKQAVLLKVIIMIMMIMMTIMIMIPLKNYLEHVHNKFNKYAFCFFFCELLNICISISQVKTRPNIETEMNRAEIKLS